MTVRPMFFYRYSAGHIARMVAVILVFAAMLMISTPLSAQPTESSDTGDTETSQPNVAPEPSEACFANKRLGC